MAITAGLYELRTMLQTPMCVTGSGYEPVTGSNVFLYSNNDGNNRKWTLSQESGKWLVRNRANGLYMASKTDAPAQGANVIQWTYNARGQLRWNIIETGDTVTLDGYTCPVVKLGSYATADGETWMLDVDGAMTTNSSNIELNRASSAASQTFALYPVTVRNNAIPTPSGFGWASSTNANPYRVHAGHTTTAMYLGWKCPTTWTPDETRGFERRIRKRVMDAETSTWTDWSEWSQWADVDPVIRGEYCYDANTVDPSFAIADAKCAEFQAEVRGKSPGYHGGTAAANPLNIVNPTPTFTSAGASADGFLVDVTSDYAPAWYTIKSIELDGVELLGRDVAVEILEQGQSVRLTLPWDRLLSLGSIPSSGVTATAYATRSTDLYANIGGGRTWPAQLTLSYGQGPATDPTVTDADGLTLEISHPSGILGAWTSDGRGVYASEDGERVVYPFGRPFDLLVAVGDGTIYHASMPAQDAMPCHAFNWDGGALILEHVTGRMETSRTIKASADAHELLARPWQTVTFGDTLDGEFRVSGVLHDGSAYTVDDLMALMRAQHATYRAPSGEVVYAAVTSAQYAANIHYTEVDVTMTQETR